MTSQREFQLGQLALARGWIRLPQLLECVQVASQGSVSLVDTLHTRAFLSSEQLATLLDRLEQANEGEIQADLDAGETIVLDELSQNTLEAYTGLDPALPMGTARTFDYPSTLEPKRIKSPLRQDIDLNARGEQRYEFIDELGRGGMGQILRARDLLLNREIALKTLLPDAQDAPRSRERLLLEAQVTGLLEHPSIVPVYDLGALSNGEPYYTMRVVRERSLANILQNRLSGKDGTYSLIQLVGILRQVCLAIQFAHDHGVIHRDLKPENILIGHYGEVFVIDWGIAKLVNEEIGSTSLRASRDIQMGAVFGTPQYMAPEQAQGDNDAVDQRTDVYALGAILYELLTLQPVFEAGFVLQLLFKVIDQAPIHPSLRAPELGIPRALEEICLKALAKKPKDRFDSAEAMAEELNFFLEGIKERERQQEQAVAAMKEAVSARERYDEIRQIHVAVLKQVGECRQQIPTWASPQEKEELWTLEQKAQNILVDIERHFGEAVGLFSQALGHYPLPKAQNALADLYWQRFEEAEGTGQKATAAYFENLVRQHNDGRYDTLLEGHGQLTLRLDRPGARAVLYRYRDNLRRLHEDHYADLDKMPVEGMSLPHGSYLLAIAHSDPAVVPLRVPFLIHRLKETVLDVKLYERRQIPEDFIVIPKGDFVRGSREVVLEESRMNLADFAIMRHPVTCAEYLEFLNDVAVRDVGLALQHAPRVGDDAKSYFPLKTDKHFIIPQEDAEGDSWDPRWPVCMINLYAAEAYAAWRSERDGVSCRLPTSEEWEKAARGVDGRLYPWGDVFDPIFCHMRESRPGRALPAVVGSYPTDRSPYGVLDMAGNICEWTATSRDDDDQTHTLRGGCYASFPLMCRLDWYLNSPTTFRHAQYGFRLAMTLP